jgi:hypothetical protein
VLLLALCGSILAEAGKTIPSRISGKSIVLLLNTVSGS